MTTDDESKLLNQISHLAGIYMSTLPPGKRLIRSQARLIGTKTAKSGMNRCLLHHCMPTEVNLE